MPTFGTEVEYPMVQNDEEMTTFTRPSYGSHDIRSNVQDDYNGRSGWPDGYIGSDPTAGLELRSDPMGGDSLKQWYREAIVELSKYAPHEPSGITANSRASTIGLHLHFSGDGYTEEKARGLYEMSREPWFKLFACSSITEGDRDTYQVFRSNYCGMQYSDTPSNDCVNRAEYDEDHWEWRMLEPVTPDHFDLVITFMEILHDDGPDRARDFAMALVDDLDPTLTAVKRAEAIGIRDQVEQMQAADEDRVDISIDREPRGSMEQRDFFRAARAESHAPYIYSVDYEDSVYYVFQSDNYSEHDNPFEINNVEFQYDSVLRLEDSGFDVINSGDTYDVLHEQVEQYRATGGSSSGGITNGISTSPATDALLDRLADAVNGDN